MKQRKGWQPFTPPLIPAATDGDPVEPSRKLRIAAKGFEFHICLNKSVLDNVVGIITTAQHAQKRVEYSILVTMDKATKCLFVTAQCRLYQSSIVGWDVAHTRLYRVRRHRAEKVPYAWDKTQDQGLGQ